MRSRPRASPVEENLRTRVLPGKGCDGAGMEEPSAVDILLMSDLGDDFGNSVGEVTVVMLSSLSEKRVFQPLFLGGEEEEIGSQA